MKEPLVAVTYFGWIGAVLLIAFLQCFKNEPHEMIFELT